ncbi:MAG: hypothetical protein HY329_19135 [Chloroflexi bacterium]|nr:hypothetical protein [Chloroflexota bacterium]
MSSRTESATLVPVTVQEDRARSIPASPRGWQRLVWIGPGFLWMVSATGSGELRFTPRIGALYEYVLIWALLAAVVLKWFREIGRFTVCRGATILDGFKQLAGPRTWAIWLILGPQALVTIATIAGLMWYSYWLQAKRSAQPR